MTPRLVAGLVGVAFALAGLAILLLPVAVSSAEGAALSCGNAFGWGSQERATGVASVRFPGQCAQARDTRRTWALPVAGFGALLLVGAVALPRPAGRHS
ncbi:hypothetical protein F0L68_07900 [Solihabitans fulvus]|uniref:Uncharacterized protein n=1 Tax=Solihabitans fulvus TaxID=1892852 RepID=A0A5B2XLR9_9PSEU|nr:hypothetical protein [Solihabitans fulvus]KAA2264333.1 hypothetical protein F0L68_07900 [Solihabitans fulvus]